MSLFPAGAVSRGAEGPTSRKYNYHNREYNIGLRRIGRRRQQIILCVITSKLY
jgi:hypothetical protein